MNWWRRLLQRHQLDEQLEKEMRFHLDKHISDLTARGIEPEQARRLAQLELGGAEQVKEQCRDARGTRWLEDLLQDTRYALRIFRMKPGFTAVALLTLALGIGAATVMFTVINSVLLEPLDYPEPGRLLTLRNYEQQFGEFWGFSNLNFKDIERESRTLGIAAWTYGGGTVSSPGQPEYVFGREVSAELFPTLGVSPVRGRNFLSGEDRPGAAPVAIISYGLWQRDFAGDPGAVGRTLVLEGKPRTIVGIAPSGFQLDGPADVFTPLEQATDPRMENRAANFIHLVARLRPRTTLAEGQAELTLIVKHLADEYPKSNAGVSMRAYPVEKEIVGDIGPTLWLLLGAVALVLIIACVNIASLLLARAVSRERELAMRVALGAGRGRLVRQCLTESAILGLCGGMLGVAMATVSVRPFVALWPGNLPRAQEVHLDCRVVACAFGISLLSGLLFGLAPALRVPVRNVEQTLRGGARSISGGSRRLHSVYVISEVALAVVLLVSAGMLGRTLLSLSSRDPGLDVHDVLTAHVALSPGVIEASPDSIRAAWQQAIGHARGVPGVEDAALADIVPMREGENSLSYWASPTPPPPDKEPFALASCVTSDYLKVMRIPLRQGRFFDDRDRVGGARVVVVDENLARHAFGTENAVGKHLWIPGMMGTGPVEIVGVVGHVRHWGMAGDDYSPVHDQMYYPFAQVPDKLMSYFSSFISIVVRTNVSPLNLAQPLRQELRGTEGDQTLYEVSTMEQLESASLARQRFLLQLFAAFAGVALLLACVGVYGVLAYLTGQRVPEIGVRVALGASARDVMWMVLGQSLGIILVGVFIGIAGALEAARVLNRLVEGMQPASVSTFAITVAVLAIAAFVASFVPARRASRIDPVTALREQ